MKRRKELYAAKSVPEKGYVRLPESLADVDMSTRSWAYAQEDLYTIAVLLKCDSHARYDTWLPFEDEPVMVADRKIRVPSRFEPFQEDLMLIDMVSHAELWRARDLEQYEREAGDFQSLAESIFG